MSGVWESLSMRSMSAMEVIDPAGSEAVETAVCYDAGLRRWKRQ